MSPLRVLRGLVFGAAGGVLGWFLVEFMPFGYPFQPARWEQPGVQMPLSTPGQQGLLGLALGLAIGGLLGVSEGLAEGTMSRFKRAVLWFASLGALGGYVGMYFGQLLFAVLGGKVDPAQISGAEFVPQILARSLAWALIGLFLGAVFGVPGFSFRRSWNGAVGGGIGGFLGGFVFQVLVFSRLFQGPQVRFLGFVLIGAFIGFFINLIAEALKQVWVKVLVGRNEGREYVLDTPLAYVGRDELAEVPVFLDPMVPKRMASFRLDGGRYALYPESAGLPITVNGQSLAPGQMLRDGDAIQFGRVTLGYFEKATATGRIRPVDSVALAEPPAGARRVAIPRGRGVCEFCGQPRDPATGACACTVPADAGLGAAPPGYGPGVGFDPAAGYPAPGYPTAGYGAAPGYDPAGYGAPPAPAYLGEQDPAAVWGAPTGYAPADPGATMLDPGGFAAPVDVGEGPRLVALSGPHSGQVFPLLSAEVGIGRDPGQEVALTADGTASRRHAQLVCENGAWVLRDQGSANGTWVNGVRVLEQPLFPGDTVRVGGTQLRFEG